MQQGTIIQNNKLPGFALVGSVVAAIVWLVLSRIGVKENGLKLVVTALIAVLTVIFYSDQVASNLDELLYDPNYNPQVLTAESRRAKGHWRYLFLPGWKRLHAERTLFGAGLRLPIPEDGKGFLDQACVMLTPEDRKALDRWLGNSKALRSIVPLLAFAAVVQITIAFAWQSGEQRSADLLIAAGEAVLALAAIRAYLAWRVRYLEELFKRARRAGTHRPYVGR